MIILGFFLNFWVWADLTTLFKEIGRFGGHGSNVHLLL